MSDGFANPFLAVNDLAEMARPPRRMSVPAAAEQYVILNTPGGYAGPWRNDLPYYMVAPAECLTNRKVSAVIFVGPAQSGKTQMLVDNWAAHMVTAEPSDMMIVQTSQDTARDYSKRRIDRLIDSSPALAERLKPGGRNNNTYDKYFKSGAILTFGWPSKNVLAGKAIGKMALTDYDRMPVDVDGEGSPFFLAQKRTTTFLSRGKTMAESSPSMPILSPKWKPSPERPHEAPPTRGILGLYNTGDRRRIYGKCPHCTEYFTPSPGVDAMAWPEGMAPDAAAALASLVCTVCGGAIDQTQEREFKRSGVWLVEGQRIDAGGKISGEGIKSGGRASFWLPGWFAAFQSWRSIMLNYLLALKTFEATGDEQPLKNTTNLDQGAPYLPRAMSSARSEDALISRQETIEKRTVPGFVRFLLAAVDVQKNRFVVQVEGFGPGLESVIIDRFDLRFSYRNDATGAALPVAPGSYPEDWDVLTQNVVNKEYVLEGGGAMRVFAVFCDSGGIDQTTDHAYRFFRRLKRLGVASLHKKKSRFFLVKGGSSRTAPPIRETFPDSTDRKDRKASAGGSVPVYLLNTEIFKDIVANDLDRAEPGPRFVRFPAWLPASFFSELTAETRTARGWENPGRARNESFDLMAYTRAGLKICGADRINWEKPPPWAEIWEKNTNVREKQATISQNTPVAPVIPDRSTVTGSKFRRKGL